MTVTTASNAKVMEIKKYLEDMNLNEEEVSLLRDEVEYMKIKLEYTTDMADESSTWMMAARIQEYNENKEGVIMPIVINKSFVLDAVQTIIDDSDHENDAKTILKSVADKFSDIYDALAMTEFYIQPTIEDINSHIVEVVNDLGINLEA
jgi:hypothetical protein